METRRAAGLKCLRPWESKRYAWPMNLTAPQRRLALALLLCVLLIAAALAWRWSDGDELPDWIVAGNGRLEATAIDVSAKAGGRILDVKVREGDFVRAGDEIGRMDTQSLQAQLRSAEAQSLLARPDQPRLGRQLQGAALV